MKLALALALLLCLLGCTAIRSSLDQEWGKPSRYDTQCGVVGGVEVWLRYGAFATCPEALGFVEVGLSVIPATGLAVVIGNEPAGWDVGPNMEPVFKRGMWYPGSRVIALTGMDERALLHELGHAYDNRRDNGP